MLASETTNIKIYLDTKLKYFNSPDFILLWNATIFFFGGGVPTLILRGGCFSRQKQD